MVGMGQRIYVSRVAMVNLLENGHFKVQKRS